MTHCHIPEDLRCLTYASQDPDTSYLDSVPDRFPQSFQAYAGMVR